MGLDRFSGTRTAYLTARIDVGVKVRMFVSLKLTLTVSSPIIN